MNHPQAVQKSPLGSLPLLRTLPFSSWAAPVIRTADESPPPSIVTAAAPAISRSVHTSGLWRTAVGQRYEDALRASATALRAYLAVRLRSHQLGRDAFEILREALDEGHGATVFAPPGARAHLFLLARRITQMDDAFDGPSAGPEAAPWDAAPLGSPAGYGTLLDDVRQCFAETELETLELVVGRGLSIVEVAHVLEESTRTVEARVASSRAWLTLQLEGRPLARTMDADAILRDALRVLPPPAGDDIDAVGVPPPLPAGAVVGERFRIEACIGGGAFGHVYRARDVRVATHVTALKVMHKPARTASAMDGAMAELARTASAFHPSLVQLKEHGWYDGRLWFVMPWYEGETLAQRTARAPLSESEAARVLAPIARALASLHAAGVRHQDVKPENILLARLAGHDEILPVLLDLGVAVKSEELAVAGTPMYFAPEMAKRVVDPDAQGRITEKADVFALAMTLAHALRPAPGTDPDIDTFLSERASGVLHLPRFRGRAGRALKRWLSTSADIRPSAAELAAELDCWANEAPAGPLPRVALVSFVLAVSLAVGAVGATRFAGDAGRVAAALTERRSYTRDAEVHALRERIGLAEERAADLEARLSRGSAER